MGDRANILVKADKKDSGVYLYTHWGRESLPGVLGEALKPKLRWDDPQYLARIIFDKMVGKNQGGECGFGISSQPGDGTDYVLIVDCDAQTITDANLDKPKPKIHRVYTFEEFVASPQMWSRD